MTTPQPTTRNLRYIIELPFPVSANRLWRTGARVTHTRGRTWLGRPAVYLSPQYVSWTKQADALWLTQKRKLHPEMLGHYCLGLTFSAEKRRGNQDGDNLQKCVHDWLQRIGIIKNDALCDGASWQWGEAPSGCLATLEGSLWSDD